MNEKVIGILEYLGEKFGVVVDWTSENIMPYAEELIIRFRLYSVVLNLVWLLIGVLLIIISIRVWKNLKKKFNSEEEKSADEIEELEIECKIKVFIIGFTILVGMSLMIGSIEPLIESIFIPEKAIIEMIGG